jgi:hypothetical protein
MLQGTTLLYNDRLVLLRFLLEFQRVQISQWKEILTKLEKYVLVWAYKTDIDYDVL